MKSTLSILVATSALALSGCGGNNEATSHPVGPEGLRITADNQTALTRATVAGGLSVSNIQTATNAGGSAAQPTAATRAHALAKAAHRALAAAMKSRVASASTQPAAVHPDTQACAVGGSLTTTFDDRDNDQALSAGDVLTVEFDQCKDSATSVYDGKAVITLTTVPSATQITGNVVFQALSDDEAALTATLDGSLSISEVDSDTESTTTLGTGGGTLTVTLAAASYNDVVQFDTSTQIVVDQQTTAGRSTLTVDGPMQAQTVAGGAATLQTVSPLVQLDGDAYPSSGVVKMRGAHGTLLMTVLSASSVQLQLDADDDGSYESTTTVPWTSLVP